MAVYIKNIDKPKACCDCPFNIGVCIVKVAVFGKEPLHEPGEWWCPLVEVPSHGDLIDRDALNDAMYHEAFETDSELQKWDSGCWIRYKMFERNRDLATVVIPAERSEA